MQDHIRMLRALGEAAVEAMREDPFMDDAALLGTTMQDARMEHYARITIAAVLPRILEDASEEVTCCAGCVDAVLNAFSAALEREERTLTVNQEGEE